MKDLNTEIQKLNDFSLLRLVVCIDALNKDIRDREEGDADEYENFLNECGVTVGDIVYKMLCSTLVLRETIHRGLKLPKKETI